MLPAKRTTWPATIQVELGADVYADVIVEQRGFDVRVEDDEDSCLDRPWEIDMARGPRGRELVPVSRDSERPQPRIRLRPTAETTPATGDVVLRLSGLESAPSPSARCRAWRAFLDARVESFDRQPAAQERAVAEYARSVGLFRRTTDLEGLGQALLNLAAAEYRLGRTDAALHHLSESRKLLGSLESDSARRNLVDAWNETAWILFRKGRTELAAELFRDAATLARARGLNRGLARALNGQGLAHKRLGRWDEALGAYRQAAELAGGDLCVESAARTNLGTVYTRLGEFQNGLAELTRAVELASRETGSHSCQSLAAALNSQAALYANLGRWDLAASASQEAILHASGDERLVMMVNHARALARMERTEAARQSYLQTIEAARQAEDSAVEFAARLNLANLLLRSLGDTEGARHELSLAETLLEAPTSSRELAHLLMVRSRLLLADDQPAAALGAARRAGDMARLQGHPQLVSGAKLQAARCLLALHRPAEAAVVAGESVAEVESLRSHSASFELRATYLADRSDYFETWIEALLARHLEEPDGDHARQALEIAERARSRAFLDMLDNAAVERADSLDPRLAELQRRRESLFLRRESRAQGEANATQDYLDHQLRRTESAIVELEAQLRASRPQWSSLKEPDVLDLGSMRSEVVDSETALLHSFVGDHSSWLWLVTESDVRVFRLPGRDHLEGEVRSLLESLRARTQVVEREDLTSRQQRIQRADEEFLTRGRGLAEQLLQEALEGLRARRLVVVADGPLAYVPFGALPDPAAASYRPLVFDYQWVYLTSVSVLRSLRRQETADTEAADNASFPRVAVIADPVFSSADPRLDDESITEPATRSGLDRPFRRLRQSGFEAQTVASLAGPGSLVAVGLDATADLVRSGRLRDFDIVHFATHGVIEAEYPELSSLVLALRDQAGRPIDGFLRLPDIYRLELDADLVVLSACETALGRQIRGEGLVGLTRGFQYAGASSVLASLWAVQDRATRDLMERFYRYLLEHRMRPVDALHQSQRDLASDPAVSPYHWAGFVMQGDWR